MSKNQQKGEHQFPFIDMRTIRDANGNPLSTILEEIEKKIQFDDAPTEGSTNLLTSGAVFTALEKKGFFVGVCTTDAATAAKTVSIPGFVLTKNSLFAVFFEKEISVEKATLNVNDTGAKLLNVNFMVLQAGTVKAKSTAFIHYDGARYNIVNVYESGQTESDLYVDLGLPSGLKWASRDIDLTKPGGFCETPFTYEKSFFSWGNIEGHNPSSVSAFDYNWGGVNQAEPWYDGQPYGSTPGNTLTGNIAVGEDFDAARANLGSPWRMPTTSEFNELFNANHTEYIDANGEIIGPATANKLTVVNGIKGIYLRSKVNYNRIFFSCSGYGDGSSWYYRGSYGYYWSSTFNSGRGARDLSFLSGGVYPQYGSFRYYGFAVRAVQ